MAESGKKRPSLAMRIFINIILLFLITIGMGITSIWFAGRFDTLLQEVTGQEMTLVQASRQMETSLANQKGFVTYFFLDRDSKWLKELMVHRRQFTQCLEQAASIPQNSEQTRLLNRISTHYKDYTRSKDRVIELYQAGREQEGESRHWEVREKFFALNDICRAYRDLCEAQIHKATAASRQAVRQILLTTILLLVVQFLLAAWLLFKLFSHVIIPIRQLSQKTRQPDMTTTDGDEIRVLRDNVYDLMDDVDRTRGELEQSKEMLLHSEKMALVGKLAPVVAHSIRNPMTSINMRLFSLQRNLPLTETQQEDFEVVSEEMRRLDHIVHNFLEFSRPHKLRKQKISVPKVMDMALQLLSYRLDLCNISVSLEQDASDMQVEADPELLKEVFVNLIVNACDAMENGGSLVIVQKEILAENIGRAVQVSLTDTGPGMSTEMQARVLKPFETTKSDGTGLGLFIVVKIIEEHGGTLDLQSTEGKGTTFTIMLPGLEEGNE